MEWILFMIWICLSQQQTEVIDVHLLAHSHIDPGWRKTFSEYFYKDNYEVDRGHRDFIGGVRSIYRSMVEELLIDKSKKYIISEMCYFELWYRHSSDHMKSLVQQLIRDQRVEVGGGGYVAPDDATPYYDDLIDLMMLGHEWLRKTFTIRPTTSWQMDTFGASAGQVQLSYDMGLIFLITCRLDYYDKHYRIQDNRMQTIFAPQQQYRDTPVFTHITHMYYSYPLGYWFDANIDPKDHSIRDIDHDIMNVETNIEQKAKELVANLRGISEKTHNKDILQMIGNDFALQSNGETFENYDRLFDHINAKKKRYQMNVDYILPNEYLDKYIMNSSNNNNYTVKRSDFLPIRNAKIGFWSGFYSSKQNAKYVSRWSSIYLNQIRSILGLVYMNSNDFDKLRINQQSLFLYQNKKQTLQQLHDLEQSISLFQHHDAITGTCYNKVTNDYLSMQFKAQRNIQKMIDGHIDQVLNTQFIEIVNNQYINCQNNDTLHLACPFVYEQQNSNNDVLVSIYNQFNHRSRQLLTIKVNSRHSYLLTSDNIRLEHQEVFCINPFDDYDCDLSFIADLQPISFNFYKLLVDHEIDYQIRRYDFSLQSDKDSHIIQTNDHHFLIISKSMKEYKYYYCGNGKLDQDSCNRIQFIISYGTYSSYQQNIDGSDGGTSSGHYVLHVTTDYEYDEYEIDKISVHIGSLMTRLYVYIRNGKTQAIISFYNTRIVGLTDNIVDWKQVDIETIIEPLNVEQRGKEFIFRIIPSILGRELKQDQFYTDRNGLDLQERKSDRREDYNLGYEHDRVAQNMYPVTSCLFAKIPDGRFAIVVDRTMAGGLIGGTRFELLMQREHVVNDGMGISEPLVEKDINSNKVKIRNRLNLLFIRYSNEVQYHRKLQQQRDSQPLILFSKTHKRHFERQKQNFDLHSEMRSKNRMLNTKSNDYVKINYLPRKDGSVYVRLINLNEDHEATINITNKYVQELSIQGSWKIEDINQLHKKYDFTKLKLTNHMEWKDNEQIYQNQQLIKQGQIKLIPMQIRTFLIGDDDSELQKYNSDEEQCEDYNLIYSKE